MKSKRILRAIALLVAALLFVAALPGCRRLRDGGGASTAAGDREETFTWDGAQRTYLLHLPPAYDGKTPLPLVMVIHGGLGNANNIAETSGMSAKADREGFIAVYPNGSGRAEDRLLTWNGGYCCGYAMNNNIDDVGFLGALIEQLENTMPADPHRIYLTGFSNGAIMAYRLAAERSDLIAAMAPVSGAIGGQPSPGEPAWTIPRPAQPVSVIAFHGKRDNNIPYDGGQGSQALSDAVHSSVSQSINFWINADGSYSIPSTSTSANGNIIASTYTGGKNGSEVVLYTIVDGGHAWPGGNSYTGGDTPTRDISATDLMWDFFAAHPKP